MPPGSPIRHPVARRVLASLAYPLTLAAGVLSAWALLYPLALPLYWIILPLGIAFLLVGILERLLPYRERWNQPQGDIGTDAFYIAFNYGLREGSGILFKVGLVAALAIVPQGYALQSAWPQHWHPLLQVALAILVLDFFEYWFHRASHKVPLLWRFHAIHHSPKRLYFFNAARFHFVDWLVLNAIEVGVLFLVGVDPAVIALTAVFVQIHGLFQHANIESRLGPLNYLMSTAELHRWHHSKIVRESDTNFGNNVILWDLLFGTFFLPGGREVGVLGLLNPDYPKSFLGQAVAPFRRHAQDKPADYRQRREDYLRAVEAENRHELSLVEAAGR